MLYNLSLISTEELQHLFLKVSKRFLENLDKEHAEVLKEIRNNLKDIVTELDKRRVSGVLN